MSHPTPTYTEVTALDVVELYDLFFNSIMRNHKQEKFEKLLDSLKKMPKKVLKSDRGSDVAIISDELIIYKNADTGINEMVYMCHGEVGSISSKAVDWVMDLWFKEGVDRE